MQDLKQLEAMLEQYIEQGDKAAAVKAIHDLCVEYAAQKEFEKADALREKLYEVDPMALKEIIATAEIVERAKSGAVDKQHMQQWKQLYQQLTTEEANALYYSLKVESRPADDMIFFQGEENDRLYFVDQGQLSLFYRQGDREVFLKKLNAGSIAGQDTFFPVSICTTSLTTLTAAKLRVLERKKYMTLIDKCPAIESKIIDFSLRQEKIEDLINEQGLDRRTQRRHKIKGKISNQILDASGNPVGRPFRGDLADISVGGASFYITANNRESVRRLLGRTLKLKFDLNGFPMDPVGQVISVVDYHFSDFSVHIRFRDPLSGKAKQIVERT